MKKVILFIAIMVLLNSCRNQEQKTSAKVTFNNQDYKELSSNLIDYLDALYMGNVDKAMEYCYPDLFVWMQKKVPHNIDLDSIKGTIRIPIIEAKKFNKDNGISFQFQINKVQKKVIINNHHLALIAISGIQKTKDRELKINDVIVAISDDKGKNWKFMIKDDEMTKEILAIRFSDETIKKLLEE